MVRKLAAYVTRPADATGVHAVTFPAPMSRSNAPDHDHTYSIRAEPDWLSAYRQRKDGTL